MNIVKLLPTVSLFIPGIALAQPPPDTTGVDHEVPTVSNAFEIGIATGYTQGGGKLGDDMGYLEDYTHRGGAIELDLGYRILPQLSVGAYVSFSLYDNDNNNMDAVSATAGLQAAWHIRPARSIDPWLSLGAGWKGMIFEPAGDHSSTLVQGLELARLQLGLDYRLSRSVAIAPVISGSVSTFTGKEESTATALTEVHDKEISFTGFAGLSGRFDLGGAR